MKVSIITVNRNNAPGLKKSIASVHGQTFSDREHIVIDGGSTDGSKEIIEAQARSLAAWVSEPDGGIYPAMNKGLGLARGEYVHFLNSGDCLAAPDVLERVFARSQFTEDMLYGDSLRPDGAGGWKVLPQPDELTVAQFFGMGICHQTLFYRRARLAALGGYDERYRIVADWDLNLRALLAGCVARHLPFPVAYYDGLGVSAALVEEREREKTIMLQRTLPAAVFRDYMKLRELEADCGRLKQMADWVAQIRRRSPWVNYAMATKWAWEKWSGRGDRGRKEGPV